MTLDEAAASLGVLNQKSPEWYEGRVGKLTSSQHYRLMTDASRPMTESELEEAKSRKSRKTTIVEPTLLSDGAMTYVKIVAAERFTSNSSEKDITTKAMEHGILYEPVARRLYERVKQCVVTEVGSITYKAFPDYVSGSPDGLVGSDGGIEIKCPEMDYIHLDRLLMKDWMQLKEDEPNNYWQCISGILLSNRRWWDFVSYSPNYPTLASQIKIIRLPWEEVQGDIRLLAVKLKSAVEKVKEIVENLTEE